MAWIWMMAGASGSAQKMILCGHVTDQLSGEPLIGATVKVMETSTGGIANDNGFYSVGIRRGSRVRVQCSFVGYQTATVTLEQTNADSLRHDFSLVPSANRLDEVLITSRSEMRQLRESGMPISVIGQQQLQGTASNINDVLARTVGITMRNTGGMGSASRISVRGLEGKRMGLFIDDSPLGNVGNFVALSDIPTSMIERIEVYKGIVPYKFGGSALGGAVNVVTKEYPPTYLDVSYEIASFNTHQFSTVLKRTNHKTGLQFGAGGVVSYSDNDYTMKLTTLDGRTVRRDHDRFRKYIGGISIKATEWWFDEMKLELEGVSTNQQIQGFETDIREAYNHSSSLMSSLTLKRQNFFADGLDFDFDLAFVLGKYGLVDKALRRYDWDGNSFPAVSPYGGEQGSYPSDADNRSIDLNAKLNMNYTLARHHAVNLNVCATNTNMFPKNDLMDKALGFIANFHSRMSNLTVGLSYDLSLFDNKLQNALTLKEYLYSSHSRNIDGYSISSPKPVRMSKNYFGFSDAIRYAFTPDLMVKGSFNSEVRIPTSEELIGNGYSVLASPALRPERVKGVNLGLLYRHQKKDGGILEAELNAFFNTLEDMVRFVPDMVPSLARYRNFGTVRTKGVELELKGDVHPLLYLYANGTLQDLRDVRKTVPETSVPNPTRNMRIPNVPYLMGNFGAEFHKANLFGGKRQNTRILFDASYVHKYFYDFEMSKNQERKIPTSFTMDTAVEHAFMDNRWTLTLKMKNIADRRVISELNCPLPGRSVWFKVRYLLK
ncbi:TonB-dependent receptor [Bacteroidaceae bacterium 14-104]|nr:TonB-dependent receptor [Phocaeicola oris]MCE2615825.1 TonB-dependent receptor [Phocaeicola oris]